MSNQTPRILQQQPERESDRDQQQQGSTDFQNNKPGAKQQMGEGSYEGTREDNKRTEEFLKTHDVEKEAQKAQPQSEQEARDIEQAEEEGKSHAKK